MIVVKCCKNKHKNQGNKKKPPNHQELNHMLHDHKPPHILSKNNRVAHSLAHSQNMAVTFFYYYLFIKKITKSSMNHPIITNKPI